VGWCGALGGEESAWTEALPLSNSNPCSLIEIYTYSVLYGVLERGKRRREEEKELGVEGWKKHSQGSDLWS